VNLERGLTETKGTGIAIGAQNVHWEKSGAFTGEISGQMIKELGIGVALTGHSERRQYFGETDETVRKRTESLLEQGLQIVACIGETRTERESGQTVAVLQRQITSLFSGQKDLGPYLDGKLSIAYEPVWAIGTGLTATPAQAEEAHQVIRKSIWDRFGMDAAGKVSILYGGSVTPENIEALMSCPNIDGALIGGASLKPEGYLSMVKSAGKIAAGR
jgi:triosephosphate isomerase